MAKVMADVLKREGSSYPDKAEAESNYHVGQKLYLEYQYKMPYRDVTGIAEFKVTGILLNTLRKPHETMLEVKTDDTEYTKRLPGTKPQFLIFESDIEAYIAKNTELLHEMRGQLASSLYTTGKRYAHVELDNGRHIAINEIKDSKGNYANRLRISLYANSEEIQEGIFQNTHHAIRIYDGPDSVDFIYQSLHTALQVNENIKTTEFYCELEEQKKDIQQNTTVPPLPVASFLDGQSGIMITNAHGESIKLNMMEFWEIVRFGEEVDTRDEVETFLSDCNMIGNIPVSLISDNEKALSLLTEKVIRNRVYNESSDEIYDTVIELKNELKDILNDDFLHEIDCFIEPDEVYYGISGSVMSMSACRKLILDYILNHEFEPEDNFSDMVYHAIFECQDEIKSLLNQSKNISLEDKIQAAENSKEKEEQKQNDSIVFER